MNLHRLMPHGYNPPTQEAMLISQWWHQGFLWDWWSYQRYAAMQNMAYITYQQARANQLKPGAQRRSV